MIRQMAQCAYCQDCEVALTDDLEVVFNPDAQLRQPCRHLIYAEGRYSQFGLSPLPGRKTKLARVIGSTEFEWQHPSLIDQEDASLLRTFLKDLVAAGNNWEDAPPEAHTVQPISLDQNVLEADGRKYPSWSIEGTAIFAGDPDAFIASLPACLGRQRSPWTDLRGSSGG